MWNQVSYDPRSLNKIDAIAYREAWKIQDYGVLTRDLAIPVRRSNQLSYEATGVGSWSFLGSNEPWGMNVKWHIHSSRAY